MGRKFGPRAGKLNFIQISKNKDLWVEGSIPDREIEIYFQNFKIKNKNLGVEGPVPGREIEILGVKGSIPHREIEFYFFRFLKLTIKIY